MFAKQIQSAHGCFMSNKGMSYVVDTRIITIRLVVSQPVSGLLHETWCATTFVIWSVGSNLVADG